jgi:hypothetical protein
VTRQPGFDFGHTPTAENDRRRKAHALAVAARDLGLQPYELAVIGGGPAAPEQRSRVRRVAGVGRDPSVETWQLVLGMLEGLARSVPGSRPCLRCGWPVLTVVSERGRPLAIDPFPHPDGTVWPTMVRDQQRARVLAASAARPDDVPLYRQHALTCPGRVPPPPGPVPRCPVCGNPLAAALAARDPTYTTHPTCDPREEASRA